MLITQYARITQCTTVLRGMRNWFYDIRLLDPRLLLETRLVFETRLLLEKIRYVDDICLATQAATCTEIECSLTEDSKCMEKYCFRWRLKPSLTKTVISVFHLHNANAARGGDKWSISRTWPEPSLPWHQLEQNSGYKQHLTDSPRQHRKYCMHCFWRSLWRCIGEGWEGWKRSMNVYACTYPTLFVCIPELQ